MAIIALTTDQRIALENNARFKDLVRMEIFNKAEYWRNLNGGNLPQGISAVKWAKNRFISTGIIQNPTGQDFNSWIRQFIIFLKNKLVYDDAVAYNVDTVLNYMTDNAILEAVADDAFDLRTQKIEF